MAACDVIFLIIAVSRRLDYFIQVFDPILAQLYEVYNARFTRNIGIMCMNISITHVVVISSERAIAVFFPLKLTELISRRKIITSLVMIYTVWTSYVSFWLIFCFEIEWFHSNTYNRTMPTVRRSDLFVNNLSIINVVGLIIVSTFVLSLIQSIVTFNCCAIAYKLHHVAKQRQTMTSNYSANNKSNVKISRMLLVVCIVFCLCSFPRTGFHIVFFLNPSIGPSNIFVALATDIEDLLHSINSVANFFIYVLMSNKFNNSVINFFRRSPHEVSNSTSKRRSGFSKASVAQQ
jgi:hypothetical protein